MPKEKKSASSAISSARSAARGSSIIVPQRYSISGASSSMTRIVSSRSRRSSSLKRDERVHDLDERRVAGALAHRLRRPRDRAHLHLVDLGPLDAEPAAARAEHRVRLVQHLDPLPHPLVRRLLERRQELVQRRVEQPDRHRQPRHHLEDALEVGLLERQQPVERGAAAGLVGGEDHLLHHRQPVLAEEHVLGADEADALGTELARLPRVLRRVAVRAHAAAGAPRRPSTRIVSKSSLICGGTSANLADDDAAGAAVDRDRVALVELVARRS